MGGEFTTELDGRAEPLLGPEIGLPQVALGHHERRKLELKAINGSVFVGLTTTASIALRLTNSLIFAHLFLPEFQGLLALVTSILVGLYLFSHLGLQDNVIQNPRGDQPSFLNTAWTFEYIRGIVITLIALSLAWPASRFYHEPRMFPILIVLGLNQMVTVHGSPVLLRMARHLQVREITLLELFTQFVAFVATVTWALLSRTIWALVGGRVIAEIVRVSVTYWFKPRLIPHFAWDRQAVREILAFGKWILLGTALTFAASQSDRLILGKLTTMTMLGLYAIAYAMSEVPRQVIMQFCSKVGFPFLAKFQELPRPDFRKMYLRYRAMVLGAGAVLLAINVCIADIFIRAVYPERYHGACWMIGILGVGLWHTLLYSTISPAIFALHRSHYNAFAQGVYCVTLFLVLPWGYHHYGMLGAVVAAAAADLPMYFCFQYAAIREGVNTILQDVLVTLLFVGVLAGLLMIRHGLGYGSPFPSQLM